MRECEQCTDGMCKRRGVAMSAHHRKLCATNPKYALLWDRRYGVVDEEVSIEAPELKLAGDRIEEALSLIGVTKERVEKFIGGPCRCGERQRKINQVDAWARRVISGKAKNAKKLLHKIIGADE